MSNIFGKQVHDYKHLSLLDKKGKLKSHLDAMAKISKNPKLFDALSKRFTDDTQAMGFLTNNLMSIQAEILEVQFTTYRLPDFVPLINNIPIGADSYAYRVLNKYGQGDFIENYGHDAKDAQVSAGLISAPMYAGGIKAKWSFQDLQSAMLTGLSLDSATIEAATTGAIKHIEQIGISGSPEKNIQGLINQTGVTVTTAPGTFASSTDGQLIVSTINTAINQIIVQSNEVFGRTIRTGLTVYLPPTQYNYMNTLAYGVNKDKSVANWLSLFNAWTAYTDTPIEFESVIELKGAGAGGTDRMLVGFNDRAVMEMAVVDPRVLQIMNEGYFYVAPLFYKLSGLNVKQPGGMLYVDGI